MSVTRCWQEARGSLLKPDALQMLSECDSRVSVREMFSNDAMCSQERAQMFWGAWASPLLPPHVCSNTSFLVKSTYSTLTKGSAWGQFSKINPPVQTQQQNKVRNINNKHTKNRQIMKWFQSVAHSITAKVQKSRRNDDITHNLSKSTTSGKHNALPLKHSHWGYKTAWRMEQNNVAYAR